MLKTSDLMKWELRALELLFSELMKFNFQTMLMVQVNHVRQRTHLSHRKSATGEVMPEERSMPYKRKGTV